ncbi:MAG: LCP family protein [Treponema sp.]|nr:LCP family protein [Treponema sp.]
MSVSKELKGVAFMATIVIIISVTVFLMYKNLKTDPVADNLKSDETVKVLFVLCSEEGNALATEVFICYPKTKRVTVIDVTGNTGAIYESLKRTDRIDAIYKEKKIDTYRKEIEKFLDITIPFTIEITLDNFGLLTDLLDGISVFVPSPIDMAAPDGSRWMLPSGAISLDGDKVKTYINYILPEETDDDQEGRRRAAFVSFLSAFNENREVFLDKKNFPVFSSKMKANIEEDDFYKLVGIISDIQTDTITTQSVVGSPRLVDGKNLLFPYMNGQLMKDIVKQRIRMLVSNNADENRTYNIEILNGTLKQGLANRASTSLGGAGYKVVKVGNADRSDYEHTVIINHIGNEEVASSLGEFITCYNIINEELVTNEEDVADVDFSIILGKDWDGRYVRGGFGKEDIEN